MPEGVVLVCCIPGRAWMHACLQVTDVHRHMAMMMQATVKEALMFSARLRLDDKIPTSHVEAYVDEVHPCLLHCDCSASIYHAVVVWYACVPLCNTCMKCAWTGACRYANSDASGFRLQHLLCLYVQCMIHTCTMQSSLLPVDAL